MSDGLDLAAIRARAEDHAHSWPECDCSDPATTLALVDELERLRTKIAAVEATLSHGIAPGDAPPSRLVLLAHDVHRALATEVAR